MIALDLATKAWVVSRCSAKGEEVPVTSFFSLVLAYNTGAAFSFLAGAGGWQRWLFTAIAIAASVFLVWMLRRGGSRLLMCGLALILGGALGNLWDRVTQRPRHRLPALPLRRLVLARVQRRRQRDHRRRGACSSSTAFATHAAIAAPGRTHGPR